MKKIIVFGGYGFLGSHVCDKLSENKHEVTIFDTKNSSYLKSNQKIKEVGISLWLPMWILVIANIYFGIDTDFTISFASSAAKLLMGGAP